jgi:hypothetical protein
MLDAPYTIVNAIQLAVAPVFLLTGIAGMLSVLNTRLVRIADRLRLFEQASTTLRLQSPMSAGETEHLARRARLIHRAVALCTMSALCICAVIAVIFLSFFFGIKTAPAVAALFVAATLAFMLGLLHFLGEMQVAAQGFRPAMRLDLEVQGKVEEVAPEV